MNYIGKKLEPFEVDAYQCGAFIKVNERTDAGKWRIFFFYPADFTFVCPTELGDLAEHYEAFQEAGCEIYSISTDSHFVHKAWADASDTIKKIKYPMLSDAAWTLSKQFDVLEETIGQALRGTFLVDPDGVVQAYELHNLGIGRSASELLRKLHAAQFVRTHGDEVCPANWEPGAETLKPSLDLIGIL